MMRVRLRAALRTPEAELQPGAEIPLDNIKAKELIKAGKAVLAEQQEVWTHEQDMPDALRERAIQALAAADLAGGPNAVTARAAATAPFRKEAK